jgi:hypothetical protein
MYTYVFCWTHMFKHLLFVGYLKNLRITLLRRNMFQTRFHGSHVAVMSTLALMELLPLTLAVGVLPQTWAGYIHHEEESVPIRGPDPLQRRCWRWVWGWPGWPWWSRVRVFHDGKKNWSCVSSKWFTAGANPKRILSQRPLLCLTPSRAEAFYGLVRALMHRHEIIRGQKFSGT